MALVLAAAAFAACGDDGGSTTVDAAVGGADAAAGGADAAAGTMYNVALTKAQEVGTACAGAGASAAGTAKVTVSADSSTITVTDVTYSGLSGAATAAHIHANVSGMNGGVVLGFTTVTSPFSKTFLAADYTAATGAPATFALFVTSLKAGGAYLNIHTAACPGGEIRGQIQ